VKNTIKTIIIYSVLIFLVIILMVNVINNSNLKLSYTDMIVAVKSNQVEKIEYSSESGKAYVTFIENKVKKEVNIPSNQVFVELIQEAQAGGATFVFTETGPSFMTTFLKFLSPIGIILILILFWVFILQQQGGGKAMSFGKSKAKLQSEDEQNKVTFKNVAGIDEEKEELQEIVDFLKNPEKFIKMGARIPKGVLLVGQPGTGKTLLAKAVAGEANVPYYSISGSDFVEMFVGVGASRVRDLFEQAKKTAPSIIFIDEIDAVGRHRGAGLGGGHDEREQTLNQLLVEMDGFGTNGGVIVLAATNRPDILDPALLRPGRFDRQIVIPAPDVKAREEILKVHATKKVFESDVKLDIIAKNTTGFTGADLENLLNEAALLAARADKEKITMEDIEEAMIKVMMGPEKKSRVISDKDRKLTAYHEAGHALVSRFLPTQDIIHQISIVPRGMAGGYTMYRPNEDKSFMSKVEMEERIVSLLGGRVAEKLILNDISTGASNDIERATKIARDMVTKYGMSDLLGPITFGTGHEEVFLGRDFAQSRNYSEEIASKIDNEIKAIIGESYSRAEKILKDNMNKLHKIAEILLEKEKIDADEFEEIFQNS